MVVLGEQPDAAMPTTSSSSAGPTSHYFKELGLVCNGTEAAHDLEEAQDFTSDSVQGSYLSFPVVEEEPEVENGDTLPVPDDDSSTAGTDTTRPLGKR